MIKAFCIIAIALPTLPAKLPGQEKDPGETVDVPPIKSLLGQELKPITMAPATLHKLNDNLALAQKNFQDDPENVDNVIWLGRRLAYLWRYQDAIDVFSKGIAKFPDEPRLYRHRGHRWITLRKFNRAIEDLANAAELIEGRADQVEPDGQPNAAGVPTGTLATNVYYHLALAYYLKGNFEQSQKYFEKCLSLAKNNDMQVAALDWVFMSLARQGKLDEAKKLLEPITAEMEILENFAYHRRLLMYKGEIAPDELLDPDSSDEQRDLDLATYGYGVGNWYLVNGDREKAQEIFGRIVQGRYWAAFGFIAAEADLARSQEKSP